MKVIWSHLAEKSYNSNLLYLSENWPMSVVQDFILEVERTMILLPDNPDISGGGIPQRNTRSDTLLHTFPFSTVSIVIKS